MTQPTAALADAIAELELYAADVPAVDDVIELVRAILESRTTTTAHRRSILVEVADLPTAAPANCQAPTPAQRPSIQSALHRPPQLILFHCSLDLPLLTVTGLSGRQEFPR